MRKYDWIWLRLVEVQHLEDVDYGIPIGDDPFEMLSNLMVLAHEGERDLHSYEPPEGESL